jgi:Gram-negative bacterial TonB protein C-terminal
MRTHKLSARCLRIVTPDGQAHYFAASGVSSLRVFWIFRNFDVLNDRVLSRRQFERVKRICRRPDAEVPAALVKGQGLIGTLELSRANADLLRDSISELRQPVTPTAEPAKPPVTVIRRRRVPTARRVLVAGTAAAVVLTAAAVVKYGAIPAHVTAVISSITQPAAQAAWWHRKSTSVPDHAPDSNSPVTTPASAIAKPADVPAPVPAQTSVPPSHPISEAATRHRNTTAQAAFGPRSLAINSVAPSNDGTLPHAVSSAAIREATHANSSLPMSAEPALQSAALPSAGLPQVRPALPAFAAVKQDAKVVLRAIVAPDGRVRRVEVFEGPANLADEAVRAVSDWRYSPRASNADAESTIIFRLFAPDVTTVSFVDSSPGPIAAKR